MPLTRYFAVEERAKEPISVNVRLMTDSRTGLRTKVAWVEEDHDGRHSRSKQLDTEAQALIYQRLVEENGGKLPTYRQLGPLGLAKFGYELNPDVLLLMQEIIDHEDLSDSRKVELLKQLLNQI